MGPVGYSHMASLQKEWTGVCKIKEITFCLYAVYAESQTVSR